MLDWLLVAGLLFSFWVGLKLTRYLGKPSKGPVAPRISIAPWEFADLHWEKELPEI